MGHDLWCSMFPNFVKFCANVCEKWFHVCSLKEVKQLGIQTQLTVEGLRGFEKLSVKTITDMAAADLERLGCCEVYLRQGV